MAQPTQPAATATTQPKLDARVGDIECMIGFPSGRYTVASAPLWLGVAAIMTILVALILVMVAPNSYLLLMMNRCWTNWAVVFFSWWCLGILLAKWIKTSIQLRALRAVDIVPRRGDFILSPGTSGDVLRRIKAVAERPKDFLLFRRIDMALSNLGNIGEVRDVGAVLKIQISQRQHDHWVPPTAMIHDQHAGVFITR